MRKLALIIATVAVAAAMGSAPSWAAGSGIVNNTAFVDPEYGTDSGTCGGNDLGVSGSFSATGPCQSLNQALANLPSTGGNVEIMRPGIFGPVILNAAVSINGPKPSAIIAWQSGTIPGCLANLPPACNGGSNATYAVDVEATGGQVKFKDLIISAAGSTGAAVHVGAANGVSFADTDLRCGPGSSTPEMLLVDSSQGSQLQLHFHKASIAYCSGGGGIVLSPTGATPIRMAFNDGEVHNATFGLQANAGGLSGTANIQIIVESARFFSFNNSAISINAANASNSAQFLVMRSDFVNTGGAGIKLNGAGAQSVLYESAILGNATGVNIVNGGQMGTYSNNAIIGNGVECEVSSASVPCSSALTPQSPD